MMKRSSSTMKEAATYTTYLSQLDVASSVAVRQRQNIVPVSVENWSTFSVMFHMLTKSRTQVWHSSWKYWGSVAVHSEPRYWPKTGPLGQTNSRSVGLQANGSGLAPGSVPLATLTMS